MLNIGGQNLQLTFCPFWAERRAWSRNEGLLWRPFFAQKFQQNTIFTNFKPIFPLSEKPYWRIQYTSKLLRIHNYILPGSTLIFSHSIKLHS